MECNDTDVSRREALLSELMAECQSPEEHMDLAAARGLMVPEIARVLPVFGVTKLNLEALFFEPC